VSVEGEHLLLEVEHHLLEEQKDLNLEHLLLGAGGAALMDRE
jgi:hypothetical protein